MILVGSVSSNWNSCKVKDYDKNSSNPKLVLENLKLKNNHRLSLEISILIPYLTNLTSKIDNTGQD